MSPRAHVLSVLAAGVVSAFFFYLSISTGPGGIFLAFLPLMLAGLAFGRRQAATACVAGCAGACLLLGVSGMVFYLAFIALPVYYFTHRALLWRGDETNRIWYPVLGVLSELTILAAAALMLMAIATGGQGGLQAMVPHSLGDSLKDADPELTAQVHQLLQNWSFAVFAAVGWLWIVMLYMFALLANRLLALKHATLRSSLALTPRGLPAWLLLLLLVSGLLAALGQGADRFTAQALFLLLLLPYLLSGIAYVHYFSQARLLRFRRLWISCFYIALIFGRWPVLLTIAIGLYLQISEMLDRHKKMG